jgi:hypothetical protein
VPEPLRFPCFLPIDPLGNGAEKPHLIEVDKVKCVVILTSQAAADAYFTRRFGAEAKTRAHVWTFGVPAGLLKYVKQLKPAAAEQGAYHVAFEPSPERTAYGSLRVLIEELEKEVKSAG